MSASRWIGIAALALGLGGAGLAEGAVRLPAILSDHMLIQRDIPTLLWGWAEAGEEVHVRVGEVDLGTTRAGTDGAWQFTVPPFPAGAVGDITVTGTNVKTITDVLAGDVWLCSGQSNMQMGVIDWYGGTLDGKKEAAAAKYPEMRMFMVERTVAQAPREDCQGQWLVCSPQTVGGFSAVGYFFGRELHLTKKMPIGLIGSYWGGTPVEAWMPAECLKTDPDFAPILARTNWLWDKDNRLQARHDEMMAAWEKARLEAKAKGRPEPSKPAARKIVDDPYPQRAAVLYNAMIHPLLSYRIKGAIWYQGESNAGRAWQYRKLLPTLIEQWREGWMQGDFPFGIVQLTSWKDPAGSFLWPELREAQAVTAREVPRVGLVVTLDVGDPGNIHPQNKQEVGRRLGLWALAEVYGEGVRYQGPEFAGCTPEGQSLRIKFKQVGAGLTTRGQKLLGFTISGEDRWWHEAEARIEGDTVVLSSERVRQPVAARYGWKDNPRATLFNAEGFPAAPFRTDDWPLVTVEEK